MKTAGNKNTQAGGDIKTLTGQTVFLNAPKNRGDRPSSQPQLLHRKHIVILQAVQIVCLLAIIFITCFNWHRVSTIEDIVGDVQLKVISNATLLDVIQNRK